jgi:hypothetical protein
LVVLQPGDESRAGLCGLAEALRFFGDPELAAARPPWDKGARLAQLVAERRALVLDA